jgi:hypothetical protein
MVYDWPKEGEQEGPAISEILYSQSKDATGDVEVTYLDAACCHSELWPRRSIATRLSAHMNSKKTSRRDRWPRFCRDCPLHPEKMLQAAAGNGNERKISFEQKVERSVETVWEKMRLLSLPYEKRLRLVTGVEIAEAAHIGAPGTATSFDQLRRDLAKHGVRDRYPDVKQWFPRWVRSVVEKIEKTRLSLSGSTRQ